MTPSDEEATSTDGESDPEDPTIAWCPPTPEAAEDPSEDEIVSAADKLVILISNVQRMWFLRILRSILKKFGSNFTCPAGREPCK